MALDSGGIFTFPYDYTTDKAGGTKPQAARFDGNNEAVKEALDLALYRDGRAEFTADQSMGGNQLTNLGDPATSTDALNVQTADLRFATLNGSLAVSVASNALTVELKTAAGTTPAAATPVQFQFRSATAGTGTLTPRTVSAATSIVIKSTATMGASNGIAFSLWVVAFDDGGTVRLSLINCLSGTDTFALQQQGIASATQEDNSSDNAHVFYSNGANVTSKPYLVLARLIWSSGLTTAGTWDAVPSVIVPFGPGVKLPGDTVQIAESADGAVATGTTTIPRDDTIPQSTEGDQYMTKAITPTVSANLLEIHHHGNYAHTGTGFEFIAALFQDSTANAFAAAVGGKDSTANGPSGVDLTYRMRAGTTSSTTFKIRAGTSVAGTTVFNGNASGSTRLYGGVFLSRLTIREIVA